MKKKIILIFLTCLGITLTGCGDKSISGDYISEDNSMELNITESNDVKLSYSDNESFKIFKSMDVSKGTLDSKKKTINLDNVTLSYKVDKKGHLKLTNTEDNDGIVLFYKKGSDEYNKAIKNKDTNIFHNDVDDVEDEVNRKEDSNSTNTGNSNIVDYTKISEYVYNDLKKEMIGSWLTEDYKGHKTGVSLVIDEDLSFSINVNEEYPNMGAMSEDDGTISFKTIGDIKMDQTRVKKEIKTILENLADNYNEYDKIKKIKSYTGFVEYIYEKNEVDIESSDYHLTIAFDGKTTGNVEILPKKEVTDEPNACEATILIYDKSMNILNAGSFFKSSKLNNVTFTK